MTILNLTPIEAELLNQFYPDRVMDITAAIKQELVEEHSQVALLGKSWELRTPNLPEHNRLISDYVAECVYYLPKGCHVLIEAPAHVTPKLSRLLKVSGFTVWMCISPFNLLVQV